MPASKKNLDLRLCLITDQQISKFHSIPNLVKRALGGGITAVQIREKNTPTKQMLVLALQVHEVLKNTGIPLIINDRIDIALACQAEGIHLGQKDMPVAVARKILGNEILIGISAGTLDEALDAEKKGADYISAGPVFPTPSKEDSDPAIGIAELERISKAVRIPVIAIGGINESNASQVIKAGAKGIAVLSAVCGSMTPEKISHNLLSIVNQSLAYL